MAQAPEELSPPPGVRRAVKRLQSVSRELNRELAIWADELATYGISLDVEDPDHDHSRDAAQE